MRSLSLLAVSCFTLLLAACESKPGDTAPARPEGEDTTVTVFDAEHVYFGDENRRSVDVEVSFPDDSATYAGITGRFALSCPDGGCDHWDRYATFGMVLDAGTEAAAAHRHPDHAGLHRHLGGARPRPGRWLALRR
jgi:hypothetical protein